MPQFVWLRLGTARTDAVGHPDLQKLFQVFPADVAHQAPHRRFTDFADIVIEQMVSHQFHDLFRILFRKLHAVKDAAGNLGADDLVVIKGRIRPVTGLGPGFPYVVQKGRHPHLHIKIFLGGKPKRFQRMLVAVIYMMFVLATTITLEQFGNDINQQAQFP